LHKQLQVAFMTHDPVPGEDEDTDGRLPGQGEMLARVLAEAAERLKALSTPQRSTPPLQRIELAARALGANRRRHPRLPFGVDVMLSVDGINYKTRSLDIGIGGIMVERPASLILAEDPRVTLGLAAVGHLPGRVVAINSGSVSIGFEPAQNEAVLPRLAQLVVELNTRNITAVQIVMSMADEIAETLERLLKRGTLTEATLFGPLHTPLPGTDPQRHTHPAIETLRAALRPIQDRRLQADPQMLFAVAIDREGYLPVHHAPHDLPPRAGQPVFNLNHARAERIYDDRWTLNAARYAPDAMIQAIRRNIAPQFGPVARSVSAPVRIAGRRWGAACIGWRLEDD
jgi:methyl-accepting chemotaxis protein